jgi:transcriptional regulator with GAF, ATPase, and Fis domain
LNPPAYFDRLYTSGLRSFIGIALRDSDRQIGCLFLFSGIEKEYTGSQLRMLEAMAGPIGLVIANILAREQIQREEHLKTLLLSFSNDITSKCNKKELVEAVHRKMSDIYSFKEFVLSLINDDQQTHSAFLYICQETTMTHPDFYETSIGRGPIYDGVYDTMLKEHKHLLFDMDLLMKEAHPPPYIPLFYETGSREMLVVPLRVNNILIGGVFAYMEEKNTFTGLQLSLLNAFCSQIAIAVSNIKAYEKIESQLVEIKAFQSKLEEENLYLQEQIKVNYNHDELVGTGTEMKKVFDLIGRVAETGSTVLLQGETGTGKELIARAIHINSMRKDHLMVKVNCAAIPVNLIESELFGHEKGSFTGAMDRRIGKFELAHNSTLFLDEIGEMPMELQVKLLRALQEKEIERVGGKTTIKTDVRIIAATNRNLYEEINAGRFRSDLFYRLNVFPITLPPLRDRKEDIPDLAYHFIQRLSQKLGRPVSSISHNALEEMLQYDWPGNIRELEHLIERSLLMTRGTIIKEIYLPKSGMSTPKSVRKDEESIKSFAENEREYILSILKKSGGKLRGPGGAAELLNLPPSTLQSKMKKLGIRKGGF